MQLHFFFLLTDYTKCIRLINKLNNFFLYQSIPEIVFNSTSHQQYPAFLKLRDYNIYHGAVWFDRCLVWFEEKKYDFVIWRMIFIEYQFIPYLTIRFLLSLSFKTIVWAIWKSVHVLHRDNALAHLALIVFTRWKKWKDIPPIDFLNHRVFLFWTLLTVFLLLRLNFLSNDENLMISKESNKDRWRNKIPENAFSHVSALDIW